MRSFVQKLSSQGVRVNACLGELRQRLFGMYGQNLDNLPMIGEGLQRGFGHGVNGERCGQESDVQDIGGLGLVGPSGWPIPDAGRGLRDYGFIVIHRRCRTVGAPRIYPSDKLGHDDCHKPASV